MAQIHSSPCLNSDPRKTNQAVISKFLGLEVDSQGKNLIKALQEPWGPGGLGAFKTLLSSGDSFTMTMGVLQPALAGSLSRLAFL